MAGLLEMFRGFKKLKTKEEEELLFKEPTFEDLENALPENLRGEFHEIVKGLSGESGPPPMEYIQGNYDELLPEQRRFNELLSQAKHNFNETGERV
jgi:hypothetical protein